VKALVLWKYVPEQDDEIALQKGDIITVYEQVFFVNLILVVQQFFSHVIRSSYLLFIQDESGWWTGETNEGNYGLFPGKFVKLLEDTEARRGFVRLLSFD